MKKLLIFLMVAIPLLIILIVNLTVNAVIGSVSISVERVVLDKTEITATVDDIVQLTAKIYPENATNKDVTWESSNEEVATVDLNGNITFIGFGSGYVTVKTVDGNKIATCFFYATDTKVHDVILSATEEDKAKLTQGLPIGSSLQLLAQVLPDEALNKKVTYVSSDETIASVDQNGLVSGRSDGDCYITVTTEDGAHSDTIMISVIHPATSLILDSEEVVTGSAEHRIGYRILPSEAIKTKIKFESDNEEIATVDPDGNVKFKQVGSVNITLTTMDGSNISKTMKVVYTGGYAYELTLEKYVINANINDADMFIEYTTVPSNIVNTHVSFKSDNEKVAFVDGTGYLSFVGGGVTDIHVYIESSKDIYIERTITVTVACPIDSIVIDKVITTGNISCQLNPSYLPQYATTTDFFYHSLDENIAKVDKDGTVTFLSDQAGSVEIEIYANSDKSNVKEVVEVVYTGGRAQSFKLLNDHLTLNYQESGKIEYECYPSNSTKVDVKYEIISQESAAGVGSQLSVVELSGGLVRAVGGGKAVVQLSVTLADGKVYSYNCEIEVKQECTDIIPNIFLEMDEEGNYLTAARSVALQADVFPASSTEREIYWSVSGGILSGNVLTFNDKEIVEVTAVCGNVKKVFHIRYTGRYPVSAEFKALIEGQKQDIPLDMTFGQSFEVILETITPSNTPAEQRKISLKVTNENTLSPDGKVLKIDGMNIEAVGGGRATLTISVSSTVSVVYNITVERFADSIAIEDIQTTRDVVELSASIQPADATDKAIRYELVDGDTLAELVGSTLTFKKDKYGIVTLVAINDASGITKQFTVQRSAKDPESVLPTIGSKTLTIGDVVEFNFSSIENFSYAEYTISQNGTDVISVSSNRITAIGLGEAELQCNVFDSEGQNIATYIINFEVIQLVQDIAFKNDLDFYNERYVTANSVVPLQFEALPSEAKNKNLKVEIKESYTVDNVKSENLAHIENNVLYFSNPGRTVVIVSSEDKNVVKEFTIRYTGGAAIDAAISVLEEVTLDIGETIVIRVENWIPKDTQDRTLKLSNISNPGVVEARQETASITITALSSGECNIDLVLSKELTKRIVVKVRKKVTSIQVLEEYILTASDTVTIKATAYPTNATDKKLIYSLAKETDIATVDRESGVVTFNKAGVVEIVITAADGGGATKTVMVESTYGKPKEIQLNVNEMVIVKGSVFNLYVSSFLPQDAQDKRVGYEITSFAADGSGNNVVSVEDGLVTALIGGTAIIRVYAQNSKDIYAECAVTVNVPVSSVAVAFDQEIDFSLAQNAYITSRNEIAFNAHALPADATNKEVAIVKDPRSTANFEIVGNRIVFAPNGTGRAIITFISADKTNGEKSTSITINYKGNDLEQASLDMSIFTNNTLRVSLLAEESEKRIGLKLNSFVPSDNKNVKIGIEIISQNRNDVNKNVIGFDDETGEIIALAGGNARFKLKASGGGNEISLGEFTIYVDREFGYIDFDENEVKVSQPGYQINAKVYPSDAFAGQPLLAYDLKVIEGDSDIAEVNGSGYVRFKENALGIVEVKVSLLDNPDIFAIISINYTKELSGIRFATVKDSMYVNESVVLTALPIPGDIENFTYTMTIDNSDVATLTKEDEGYRLRGLKEGVVAVTATSGDFTVIKRFYFYYQVSNIELSLDSTGDQLGYGKYRVFASTYVDLKGEKASDILKKDATEISRNYLKNTYQMSFSYKYAQENITQKPEVEWSSNASSVATVNSDGLVTFVGAGKVIIRVRVKAPFALASVKEDFYEFTVVKGISVSNSDEFVVAHKVLQNISKLPATKTFANAMILSVTIQQEKITIDKQAFDSGINLTYNLYGNGKQLDLSKLSVSTLESKLRIIRNNIVLDNVTITGNENTGSLIDFSDKGNVVSVQGVSGVQINNSLIENGNYCLKLSNSSVTMTGSIIRNSYLSNVLVGESTFVAKDSIFEKSLLSSILLKDQDANSTASTVRLQGRIYIYNWLTLDEISEGLKGFLTEVLPKEGNILTDNVVDFVKGQINSKFEKEFAYKYNGKSYYEFGSLNFNLNAFGYNMASKGDIIRESLNPTCNYEFGSIQNMKYLEVATLSITVLSLRGGSGYTPFLTPASTYLGNDELFQGIKQNMIQLSGITNNN